MAFPLACAAAQRATAQIGAQLSPARLPAAGLRILQRHQRRQRGAVVQASPEEDLDQQLQADLERLRQKQAAAAPAAPSRPAAPASRSGSDAGEAEGGALAGVKDAVDKLLIADFFFILFALGWLGAGLAARSAINSTALLDTWLSLWQWVFQPAIGVLMLGALVSGAVGWAKDNLGSQR